MISSKEVYEGLAKGVADLVYEKQIAYGDSFGKSGQVMKVLFPDGIPADKMDDALVIVRIVDKLFRIANQKEAFNENPYKDIMGYGLLGMRANEKGS